MPNFASGVRTPAHFGSRSLGEAVASANFGESSFYDKPLTALYNQIHLVQGYYNQSGLVHAEGVTTYPSIDLTERIEFLAKNAEPMQIDEFADVLLTHLLKINFSFLAQYDPTNEIAYDMRDVAYSTDLAAKQAIMLKTHTHVNSLFDAKATEWRNITKGMDKLNVKIHGEMTNAPSMDKAVERLEEATRKGKEKDILAANRAIERAATAWESISKLNALFDIEIAKLKVVAEEMVPLRLLEDATRSLRILSQGTLSSPETVDVLIKALGASLRCFPELMTVAIAFADKLLRPDNIAEQFRR